MDGEAGWWTTSGNIGLPQLARVMGVGRQQQHVMDIMPLSKDDSDIHMFKVKVHYKDKDTILSSIFWAEFVGCRHYF